MAAQELAKIRRDALDHRINRVNTSVGSLDGIAWKQVEEKQASPLITISAFSQLLVTFSRHQFVQCFLGGWVSFDEWL